MKLFEKKKKKLSPVPEIIPDPMPDTPVIETVQVTEGTTKEEKKEEVKLTPEQQEAQVHAENWEKQYGWVFNQGNSPGSVTECTIQNLLLSIYCELKNNNKKIGELQDTLIDVSKE